MMDDYCLKCHADSYQGWFHSAHHFSSFNNQPYMFSVLETRKVALERDGNVKASRWCAGCHDVVPFFSGAFDDPNFDVENHPTAKAGITCTACHAITHVNSTKGNADYTIDEPIHYPFAYSTNAVLQFVNQQLVKAKPDFHKKTFLKPLHKTAEFCSTCHKVSLPLRVEQLQGIPARPESLRHVSAQRRFRPRRPQFLLPAESGDQLRRLPHAAPGVGGFRRAAISIPRTTPSHSQPSFPRRQHRDRAPPQQAGHRQGASGIPQGTLRVDIFGVKEGGTMDGPLIAPLRPQVPALKPGQTYLARNRIAHA